MSDEERRRIYIERVVASGRSRAANVEAFFRATFEAWSDFRSSGEESLYVGYSPIIVVDSEKILSDFPEAHVLHAVRNPWSAYADTKKRPLPLSLESYLLGWTLNQYHALLYRERHPDRVRVLRFEDIVGDKTASLGGLCSHLGLEAAESLATPSFNGAALEEVYPWGTIRKATPKANRETAEELSLAERDEIRARAKPYVETLDYTGFI